MPALPHPPIGRLLVLLLLAVPALAQTPPPALPPASQPVSCDGSSNDVKAINAAIDRAATAGGGEVLLPDGTCRIDMSVSPVVVKSAVVLRGRGRGITVLRIDDSHGNVSGAGSGITNARQGNGWVPLTGFQMRDLTVQGLRPRDVPALGDGKFPVQAHTFLMGLANVNNILVEDCEFLDSDSFSLGVFDGTDVVIRGNRVIRSNVDSIAVWDVSNAIITDNFIEMSGDDSISAHSNDAHAPPVRSGLLIANNTITDGPGIHVLGAKSVTISGNVIRRARGGGIVVGFDLYYKQGNTPSFAVQIVDNTIEDLIDPSAWIPGNHNGWCIVAGGSSRQRGGEPAAPGTEAANGDNVVSLYGADSGNFYANAQANFDGHSTPDTHVAASPGGYWLRIEGNTLVRTLPAVGAWSDWGYGSRLEVGQSGSYAGPITEAMLEHGGIKLAGSLHNSRVAGNIIQTTGPDGVDFAPGVGVAMDFDGLDISDNRIADYTRSAIFWPTSEQSDQRIRISGNTLDADPYFRASQRGPHGTWKLNATFPDGVYLGHLDGAEVIGNQFRDLALPVSRDPSLPVVLRGNVIHANPKALGYNPGNSGVGNLPPDNAEYSYVIEDSDPGSAQHGRMISAGTASAEVQPANGIWVQGHFVANASPTLAGGKLLMGWLRLTTGNSNVAGRDWAAIYANAN